MLEPIYTTRNLTGIAYRLWYSWSGWPSVGAFPDCLPDTALEQLDSAWEADGLRRLESKWTSERVQLTLSAKPHVSPILLASRVKGRLQHVLRLNGTPVQFSRKLSVRSIGENTAAQVQQYVQRQADKESLADERFRALLKDLAFTNPALDLGQPAETESGRYWYDLHLVLVVQERFRLTKSSDLNRLRDCSLRIAEKRGHALSTWSMMPDHVHMVLRGNIRESPEEIALSYLNNLACAMGQNAVWQFGYFAGTCGAFRMDAVRS
jgi:REP element-mobilizing transposase RayT